MWADTLLEIERAHALRLLWWGALSLVAGMAIVVLVRWRRARLPVLGSFGVQCLIWGAAELALGAGLLRALELRDLTRATRLVSTLWLEVGLTAGAVLIGVTMAVAGWMLGRREGVMGAGMAVLLHGAALLLLHARTLDAISRWI